MAEVIIENTESVLTLHDIYIKDLHFASDGYQVNIESADDNNVDNNVSIKCKINTEGTFAYVGFELTASDKRKNQFIIEVVGVFSIKNEDGALAEDKILQLLTANTVAIVFPYLRVFVSTITNMTPMGQIDIPVLNLSKSLQTVKRK